MAQLLGQPSTISYNGVTFDYRTETTDFSAKPVYDQAGRTVVYVLYTITLKGYVFDPASTDATMDDLRNRLTQPAGEFRYSDTGVGTFEVNVSGRARDVLWGPRPTLLRWRPVGAERAAEVTWTVEVAIPQCNQARYVQALMEVNFTLSWTIDRSGYTKRTYAGFLRIPATRRSAGERVLPDQADAYREQVVPDVPIGFRRAEQTFALDEAKTKLTWSIIDEEMPPAAPPPGVVEVQASHTVQSQQNVHMWAGTITATYELARGADKQLAFAYFFQLMHERIRAAYDNARPPDGNPARGALLIRQFTAEEPEVYGRRTASFTVQYTFSCALWTILRASGLWTPVSGDWGRWRASLADTALHPRGNAKDAGWAGMDVIIDLCRPDRQTRELRARRQDRQQREMSTNRFPYHYPPPDQSWLEYQIWMRIDQDDRVAEHKPLGPRTVELKAQVGPPPLSLDEENRIREIRDALDRFHGRAAPSAPGPAGGGTIQNQVRAGGAAGQILNSIVSVQIPYEGGRIANVQRAGPPSLAVIVEGYATRAGYPIAPPAIDRIGGVKAHPANRPGEHGFRTWVAANWGGVPIVMATWSLRYVLEEVPTQPLGVPPSPMMGVW